MRLITLEVQPPDESLVAGHEESGLSHECSGCITQSRHALVQDHRTDIWQLQEPAKLSQFPHLRAQGILNEEVPAFCQLDAGYLVN